MHNSRRLTFPVITSIFTLWNAQWANAEQNGFYVGLSLAHKNGSIDWNRNSGQRVATPDGQKVGIGIYGGYDWHLHERLFAGVELGFNPEFAETGITDCTTPPAAARNCHASLSDAWHSGGRLGYEFSGKTAVTFAFGYVEADVATARWRADQGPSGSAARHSKGRLSGYYIGAGTTYNLDEKSRIGVYARHYQFDSGTAQHVEFPTRRNTRFESGITMVGLRFELTFQARSFDAYLNCNALLSSQLANFSPLQPCSEDEGYR